LLWGSNHMENAYHLKCSTSEAVPDTQFDDDLSTWMEVVYGYMLSHISTGYDFGWIEWRNLSTDSPTRTLAWPTFTAGGAAGDALPLQCAALALFPTTRARGVCRKYLGGLTEGAQGVGGNIDSTYLAAFTYFANAIRGGFYTGTGVASYGSVYGTELVFAPVVSAIVSDLVRTQRRRVKGVGD
jgi:hypothetical protein